MLHRHINPEGLSACAIDDIMERGTLDDWMALAQASKRSRDTSATVRTIASHAASASERQDRGAFWMAWCERALSLHGSER